MEERQQDPWKKVLLLFVIFILLVGCTNTPRLKNDDFITAWTIAVSVVGLCIGVVFSLVLRSLAKSIEADQSSNSSSFSAENGDVEAGLPVTLPPSYSKCCSKKTEKQTADGLPSYEEAVAAMNNNVQKETAAVHPSVQKF